LSDNNYPIVGISWHDASAYCDWLSEKTGLRFKIPSEAQWEKAARGTDSRIYPWGNSQLLGEKVNFADKQEWIKEKDSHADKFIDDGYGYTAPVGSYPQGASPYGLLDMAGNVGEMCSDFYGKNYYSSAPKKNPTGPISGSARVMRGGGWLSLAWGLRCTNRHGFMISIRPFILGFRLCQEN
jgi:formylglycine-generating enzyme required for sulfatase activity